MAENVPFAVFGPGSLYIRRTDLLGSTPMNIGYAQEFSIEESAENKELFGQKQYPLVVARGTIKVTGKIKAAMISPIALNNAYYGESALTDGGNRLALGEAHTLTAGSGAVTEALTADNLSTVTYLVASTTGILAGQLISGHANIPVNSYVVSFVANTSVTANVAATGTVPTATVLSFTPGSGAVTFAADFVADLGVLYAVTAQPLQRVTTPVGILQGQYYVDETLGRYYFADGDAGVAVRISYVYETTDGTSLTVTNKDIGNTPTFELWYTTSLNAKPYTVHVFQAVSSKLSQQFKLTDFMMPELDFGIFANASDEVYEVSYPA